jgi:DNA-binding ferritin-like protein (Dps family)
MATFQILETSTAGDITYLKILVLFSNFTFEQQVVSTLTGTELAQALQDYVDQYEKDYLD